MISKASKFTIFLTCSALLTGCIAFFPSKRQLGKAQAEGVCQEWADQAPDWTEISLTDSYSNPVTKRKTFRRMCGTDTDKGLTLGNQFSTKFINSPCHHGDRCKTDLKGAIETVKTWSWED